MNPISRFVCIGTLAALAVSGWAVADDKPIKNVKWGGRLQSDWANMSGDTAYEPFLADGTEFRRARLFVSGDLHDNIKFKVQLDFANAGDQIDEEVTKKDLYIEMVRIPVVGTIRVGHIKEPFSLEELTSSKYNTFMERSVGNAFAPGRNTGILFRNNHKEGRLHWELGAFADTDDSGHSTGGASNYTARLSGLPWLEGDDNFLHLGLGVTVRNPDGEALEFETEPEAHLASEPITTGVLMGVTDYQAFNLEAAWIRGPWSAQGEYVSVDVDDGMTDPGFDAWYLQGSYFLTRGDRRGHQKTNGAFDRVKPAAPFQIENGGVGGIGAWEVAARYSMLDLTENPVLGILGPGPVAQIGGEIANITLAVNWHLNDYTRFSLNYVMSEIEDGVTGLSHDADIVQARFQIEF